MCVCAHHSRISYLSPTLSLAALLITLSSLPLYPNFAFLQTDSENRSLVREKEMKVEGRGEICVKTDMQY